MLKKSKWVLVVLALAALAVAPQLAQEKGGDDATGPYNVVAGWPENPCGEGYTFGSTAGIFAENPNKVFIFQRGCLPALKDGGGVGGLTDLDPSATRRATTCPRRTRSGSRAGTTCSTS